MTASNDRSSPGRGLDPRGRTPMLRPDASRARSLRHHMRSRRPGSNRRSPARSGGVVTSGRTTRAVLGFLVVLAVALGGPIHLWLSHGSHAGGSSAVEFVAVHDHHPHHDHGHHDHHDHHDHHGHDHHGDSGHRSIASEDGCEGGHDHSGPCHERVEDCDLCLAISFSSPLLSATIDVPGAFVRGESPASFVGTSRDIWGPATATGRGPPRRA